MLLLLEIYKCKDEFKLLLIKGCPKFKNHFKTKIYFIITYRLKKIARIRLQYTIKDKYNILSNVKTTYEINEKYTFTSDQ